MPVHEPRRALWQIASKIETEAFVTLSGDVITEFPLRKLGAAHRAHSGAMTALLVQHTMPAHERRKLDAGYDQTEWIGMDDRSQCLLKMMPRMPAEMTARKKVRGSSS